MELINKYIKQKQYMGKFPEKVDQEKREKNEWLRDEIIMQRINEDDITNDITPYYSIERQEVIGG